jgi:hypothetical protein
MKTKIYSAFPGCGKTTFYKNSITKSNKLVMDSDSSTFDKSNFPQNYIEHIKAANNIDGVDIILVSSHDVVRDGLVKEGLFFNLVYPERGLKEEYIQRYKERGNNEGFVKLLETNWDHWMDEMDKQENCNKIRLKSNEYLSEII